MPYRWRGKWPPRQEDLDVGDYVEGHPLIGQLDRRGRVVVAVRTPESERNGTEHTWVVPALPGVDPHPFDWITAADAGLI